jgi:geranylgeranyl diphosphate synthase, type I
MSTDIRTHVERALHSVIDDQRHRWQAVSPAMSVAFDELETMVLSGGKRLRPQFLHWGWVAAGGAETDIEHHSFGAAIEMLHAFALFHDDVIDDAATRRGHETTHRRLSAIHAEDGLAGESRRHGEGMAVLIGDIAYSLADVLMLALPHGARPFWNDLRLEMNVGQYLDTVAAAHRLFDAENAKTVAQFKTAKYTVERPLHIGAMAVDAVRGREMLDILSEYGLALGAAFQLRDDVLGAFGDEALTGKPVGGDFREGKPTILVSFAMQSQDPEHVEVLSRLGDSSLTDSDVQQLQRVIIDSGALARTEEMISTLRNHAVRAIESADFNPVARENLVVLAENVTSREL